MNYILNISTLLFNNIIKNIVKKALKAQTNKLKYLLFNNFIENV